MGTYAITGGSTGIGAATARLLRDEKHQVIAIDVREDADICVDLCDPKGPEEMARRLTELSPNGLDGFVPCAGVGPHVDPPSTVVKLNYFAAVSCCELTVDLVKRKSGAVVLISSNSAPMPQVNQELVKAMLDGDLKRACEIADESKDGSMAYASSKNALARWMRRNVTHFCKMGVHVNAVAPGMTRTPLTIANRADPRYEKLMDAFEQSLPIGRQGEPREIASAIRFLLGEGASFCAGSVFFVDGGSDAMMRPDAF